MTHKQLTRRQGAFAWLAVLLVVGGPTETPALSIIDFEELPLSAQSYWNGPDPGGETVDGQFGPEVHGAFTSGGASFQNVYDLNFNSWSGLAYSNTTDTTTPGYTNQFSAAAGSGASGSDVYVVGSGYLDLTANFSQPFAFDPLDGGHLGQLPTVVLPAGESAASVAVTNTTYAALSMQTGDSFAKEFGGPTGGDPDWLKLTAYGTNGAGQPLGVAVEFYLADFRAADPADDYILTDWNTWDLSPLADAQQLHFNLSSSDTGAFGMNTPAYFALDDLTLTSATLPGDFNGDGAVNAADYAWWRNNLGDQETYQLWRTNYGQMASGLGAGSGSAAATPEPATLGLILIALTIPLRDTLWRRS